jgi:hypothetical protein
LFNAVEVKVIAGDTKIEIDTLPKMASQTRVTITAKQWKVHENFDPKFRVSDIAIIHLPVRLPDNVNTAIGFLHSLDLTYNDIFRFSEKPVTKVAFLPAEYNSQYQMQYKKVDLANVGYCLAYENENIGRLCVISKMFYSPEVSQ